MGHPKRLSYCQGSTRKMDIGSPGRLTEDLDIGPGNVTDKPCPQSFDDGFLGGEQPSKKGGSRLRRFNPFTLVWRERRLKEVFRTAFDETSDAMNRDNVDAMADDAHRCSADMRKSVKSPECWPNGMRLATISRDSAIGCPQPF